MIRKFLFDERGQDLIEYSLLLGSIALAGAATIIAVGGTLDALWNIVNGRLDSASN